MISNSDQYTAANKAFFESQLAAFQELSSIAMGGTEMIVALNLTAAKESAEESSAAVKALLSAKDPQAFLALATKYAKPNVEKAAAYNQHLTSIVAETKSEFSRLADQQTAEVRAKVSNFVDTVAKNAPAGSEGVIAMLKSSVDKTNEGIDKMNVATKQAIETTQAHLEKASGKMTETVKKATNK